MNKETARGLEAADAALAGLNLGALPASPMRDALLVLVNLVETLQGQVLALRTENQQIRDEIARLKGEQGRPDIKGKKPPAPPISSERERRSSTPWKKGSKRDQLRIDRTERIEVDPSLLPADAERKGYVQVVVQELVFQVVTTEFLKAKWWSASEKRSYLATLPPGYVGQFGPSVKSFVLALATAHVSETAVRTLLKDAGVVISAGQIATWLTKGHDRWEAERDAIGEAAFRGSPYQLLDDTVTRVNGVSAACQVLTSPLATIYRTTPAKDRQTVVDVLRLGRPRRFQRTDVADQLFAVSSLSAETKRVLAETPAETAWDAATLDAFFAERLPQLGPQHRKVVSDTLAIAAYRADPEFPSVRLLVTDDAPQFAGVTEDHALCWVHEGRHYKRLTPFLRQHRELVEGFLTRFWGYYHELLASSARPSPEEQVRLSADFDALFETTTGYQALDDRIALTRAKKKQLLQVLDHPEVPLHTNAAEQAVRRRVRKRDISFGPRTWDGARAWDIFQTIAATAAQYGVSFFAYLHDRLTEGNQFPSLSSLIDQRAASLRLGVSWDYPNPSAQN